MDYVKEAITAEDIICLEVCFESAVEPGEMTHVYLWQRAWQALPGALAGPGFRG